MATGEVDLKTLLEHDYKMVQSIAGTSRLLIVDLEASHYWVTQSISLFTRLGNITKNVAMLLDTCEPYWANQASAFSKPEVAKLWKTAAGLWSALPGEQKKFDEHAARRRRERIMGQAGDESIEIEEEQLISDQAVYNRLLEEMDTTCAEMLGRIAALPDGLVPNAPMEEKAANENQVPSEETVSNAEQGRSPDEMEEPDHPETHSF